MLDKLVLGNMRSSLYDAHKINLFCFEEVPKCVSGLCHVFRPHGDNIFKVRRNICMSAPSRFH